MIRKKVVVLQPTGADGSAAATYSMKLHRPGVLRFINVDYQNQPATADLTIKADTSAGPTIFSAANTATDIGTSGVLVPVTRPAVDEGNAAGAATDAGSGGIGFGDDLYIALAQGDGQTSGDEKVIITMLIEF